MEQALAQARDGRLHILGKLTETIAAPRTDVKSINAPKKSLLELFPWYLYYALGHGGK